MSALPKQIQAQLDQAEAMQAELDAAATPQEGNPEPVAQSEPQPALQLVEPQAVETQVTTPEPTEQWEQRFRVMEGKYKAEVPRLVEQNRALTERLEQAIQALEEAKKPAAAEEPKLVTDADVEVYGEDWVDAVRRVAREEFRALSKTLAAQFEQQFGKVADKAARVEQQVVQSETSKFWGAVLQAHADFDTINEDPRWVAFLDSPVPGTRITRRAVAQKAIGDFDAPVLVEQLTLFKESVGLSPAAATPPKPKPNLNAQVAPSSSRASAPNPSAGKRIWTSAEYAAALDHRNLHRMSREEYDAKIAEAELALAEGRVQF